MNLTISGAFFRRVAAVLVAVAVVIGGRAWQEGWPPFGPTDDEWTGVFITNGQAYFGHYYAAPGEDAILRDVYYVLQTQLQSQDPSQPAQRQLTLQRLGSEIHGPQPEMRISKKQILFTERLRPDSPLVASIRQAKSGATSPPAGSPGARTPAPSVSPSATR